MRFATRSTRPVAARADRSGHLGSPEGSAADVEIGDGQVLVADAGGSEEFEIRSTEGDVRRRIQEYGFPVFDDGLDGAVGTDPVDAVRRVVGHVAVAGFVVRD